MPSLAANPDVEIINAAVAGGAGVNAQAVLQTRFRANQPPDSWQTHIGRELIDHYVVPATASRSRISTNPKAGPT